MTLLDHLPSLRRAASQRIAAEDWPVTTGVDELGRLCVGGVALTDVAAEFGTPVQVLDDADVRLRLHRHRAASGEVVPILAGRELPIGVMRVIDDQGLGLAIRRGTDLAAALAARVDTTRMVVHARGLTHDELTSAAGADPGRIVVESTMDVAYLGGANAVRRRVLVGTPGGVPDPAVLAGVLRSRALELVGLHCHPGDDIESAVRALLSSMRELRHACGTLLTEVQLTIDSDSDSAPDDLAATIGDAVEAACSATRMPRPRIVAETRCPAMARTVTVHRVASVVTTTTGPRIVVVDVGPASTTANAIALLANRHEMSPTELVTVSAGEVVIARNTLLPADVHAGDILAVIGAGSVHDAPLVAVRNGRSTALTRRITAHDVLARHVGYSAGGGND